MSRITLQHDEASRCYRLQSHGKVSTSILASMYNNDKTPPDVDLTGASPTGDACELQPVRAHKNILVHASPRMSELFCVNGIVDASKLTQTFTDIDHDSLRSIIQFIYTDYVELQEDGVSNRVQGILTGAKRLLMEDLAKSCDEFLANPNNARIDGLICIDVFQFALKHNCTALLGSVCGFFAKNLLGVSQSTEFLELTQKDIEKFLLSEPVVAANADDRCRAAIAWLNYKSSSRAGSAKCIMNLVDLDADDVTPETLLLAARSDVVRPTIKGLALTAIDALAGSIKRTTQLELEQQSNKKQKLAEVRGEAWYVVGGLENSKAFYRYDVTRRKWSSLLKLPWERENGGVCAVGKRLYVMGGLKCNKLVAAIDEYDTVLQTWSTSEASLSCAREAVAGAADSTCAYAFGGLDDDDEERDVAERYSVESKKMESLRAMVGKRFQAAAVCKNNDMIFVVGGVKEVDEKKKTMCGFVDKYDHATQTWSEVAETKELRCSPGAVFLGDDLYMAGGCASKKVEILDTETGQARFCEASLKHVREGCSAVPLDQHVICVLGGRSSSSVAHSSVETYDKREGVWSVGVIVPNMPEALSFFGLAHVRP